METISERLVLDMPYTSEAELMVVVEMITYNHEKYIAQAIESVVNQKTNFKYKIIICEDCSTDNTPQICKEYKNKYPAKIDLHLNEKNLGIYLNAKKLHELSFSSNAKYIAMLDGDDYWCDENKLQKQVDFLEANPDYAICCHGISYKQSGRRKNNLLKTVSTEQTYTVNDLASGNIIYTPSVVFRNGLINDVPDWFLQTSAGDYVLHMLNARKGKIKFFPQVMAVYRIHNNNNWLSLQSIERARKWVTALKYLMTEDFSPEVICLLKKQVSKTMADGLLELLHAEQYDAFKRELKNYLSENAQMKDDWLYEIYPQFFKSFIETRSYKLGKKISTIVQKVRHLN